MTTKSLTLLVALSLACQAVDTADADSLEVRAARDRFFQAISDFDYSELQGAVTADYVLIEDGLLWNVDSLIAAARGLEGDATIQYRFEDHAVRIEGATAWMTYSNRGILVGQTGADTFHWVESAVFRRESGAWKMALLHSTRVEQN